MVEPVAPVVELVETTGAPTTPLIHLHDDGATILADAIATKVAGKKLSPSLVTGLEGCHVRWLASYFVIPEIIEEVPDNAAFRGGFFHKVMELFFGQAKANRTKAAMESAIVEAQRDPEFAAAVTDDTVGWLRRAVEHYYAMGARPELVDVVELDLDGRGPKPGLELFVTGRVGETSRDTLGFIDVVVSDPRAPGSVIIQDWKTGGRATPYNAKTGAGLAEQRQQLLYAMILESKGVPVSAARLVYPVAGQIVNVDLNNPELRSKTHETLSAADSRLSNLIDTNSYQYQPSFLCAWCPVVKICGKAEVRKVGKLKIAFDEQPERDALAAGIKF
ncbi:MAG: PD-(D/E)XK nuclease family protein [Promicromonosporaceae bacterium]|nr:PD-(D/E)XK nuclease family protein [Promicromonosporaceae bacterium]